MAGYAITRDFRFPVELSWPGGKHVLAAVDGKPEIEIATPPELKGTFPGAWSPEDFLVAAVGSCFAVTLVAIAGRGEIPLRALTIRATGTVGRREPDPFGFKAITLAVEAATEPGREDDLRRAAERAEQGCLVSQALSIPVHLELTVTAVELAPVSPDSFAGLGRARRGGR